MQNQDGELHTAVGEYKEIDSPNKLACTWSWEGRAEPETLVTVLFSDVDGKTEVELIHTGFTDESVAQHHSHGWAGILVCFGTFI